MFTLQNVKDIINQKKVAMVIVHNQEFAIVDLEDPDEELFVCINKECDEFTFAYADIDELIVA